MPLHFGVFEHSCRAEVSKCYNAKPTSLEVI